MDTGQPNSRYEIKYRMDHFQRNRFIDRISGILTPDSFGEKDDGYGNYSIYYDNRGHRYCAEKEEGLALRTKPRLRIYKRLSDFAPVAYFFELKHRIDSRVAKERAAINGKIAQELLDPHNADIEGLSEISPVIGKFFYLVRRYGLEPTLCVFYRRQAYSCELFPGLRITFDSFVSGSAQTNLDNEPDKFTPILPHHYSVVEIKYNDRIPSWLTQVINGLEMRQVSISKYTTAVNVLAARHHMFTPS